MRAFNESGNLKTHMRTHTGDRPYICDHKDCGKSFITKGHLQTHQLIHTGEKPFKCNICSKEYARSGRLKIHLRTHTGERPYACEICGKSFTETGNLKAHMKIHENSKKGENELDQSMNESQQQIWLKQDDHLEPPTKRQRTEVEPPQISNKGLLNNQQNNKN